MAKISYWRSAIVVNPFRCLYEGIQQKCVGIQLGPSGTSQHKQRRRHTDKQGTRVAGKLFKILAASPSFFSSEVATKDIGLAMHSCATEYCEPFMIGHCYRLFSISILWGRITLRTAHDEVKITAGTLPYSMLHSGYPVEPGPRCRIPYSLYVDFYQKDPSNHEITVTNLGLGTSKSRATLRSKHTYTPGSLRYRARA